MRAGGLGIMLATAVALGGCGLLPGTGGGLGQGPGFNGGGSCSMLPGGVCKEQMDLAAARHPGATQLDLSCTVPSCTRAGGAGTVTVTLGNGARITEAFTYTGNAAPAPAPTCSGLALDLCRRLAASTVDETPPSKVIRAIDIACSAPSCTNERGEAAVRVQFADGSGYETNSGWEGGPP